MLIRPVTGSACQPMDVQAVGWTGQRAVDAQVEGAVAGEEVLLAVAHDEVAVALDGHVGELARRLQGALRLDRVDAADQDAETDLLGVDAAAPPWGRWRRLTVWLRMSWKVTRDCLKPVC